MTGLLAALQSVSGVVEAKLSQPLLSCVLLRKRGTEIELTATDLAIQVSTKLTAPGRGGGRQGTR
jgi:DNA polymerase III sliding clamp (beta) subunit (PCNA family)